MILQRPGDDLRRARATAVDEHDQRQLRPLLRESIDKIVIRLTSAAVHAHDLLSGVEKKVGDCHALIEESAWVAAQIEDQRAHPAAAQRVDRGA